MRPLATTADQGQGNSWSKLAMMRLDLGRGRSVQIWDRFLIGHT